jgi:hydroxypyruvate reductase
MSESYSIGDESGLSEASPADVLTALYWAGVEAAAPGPALAAALENDEPPVGRVWIIALGKAAHPMAVAAVDYLNDLGTEAAGGLVVGPGVSPPLSHLTSLVGDHPLPGPGSLAAAAAVGDVAEQTEAGDQVWVLVSGGATSLVAAPIQAITPNDLAALYELLITSGLDITQMNTARKRFSRWGAGRLALALHPAQVTTFIVSDVIGDDIASIGSGPCVADESSAHDVRLLLEKAGLWTRVPRGLRDHLSAVERDPSLETPKGGHPVLVDVDNRVVAGNRLMLEAVAGHARGLGLHPTLYSEPLAGEAAAAGEMVAQTLLGHRATGACLIWGGETVVRIQGAGGLGGRCQELALAAARELSGSAARPTILAAGSDGRDGPTDAAGAIVDASTWEGVRDHGRDPGRDLASHDSYTALNAAGALFRTGPTGTNVMDLVIGVNSYP